MRSAVTVEGYTLIEIIVALTVFTVGALALAASSGVVAWTMATNATSDLATRIAVSTIEAISAQCATATSGRKTVGQVESAWVISATPSATDVIESVRCPAARHSCTATYHATIWCPR